jgi:hypothetical protein
LLKHHCLTQFEQIIASSHPIDNKDKFPANWGFFLASWSVSRNPHGDRPITIRLVYKAATEASSFCHDDWVLFALEYISTRAYGAINHINWLASLLLLYGNVMNPVFSAYGDMPSHNARVGELIVRLESTWFIQRFSTCIRGKETVKNLVQVKDDLCMVGKGHWRPCPYKWHAIPLSLILFPCLQSAGLFVAANFCSLGLCFLHATKNI